MPMPMPTQTQMQMQIMPTPMMGMPVVIKGPPAYISEEQLRLLFMQHDRNRDGRLDRKELREAFRRLGAMIPQVRAVLGLYHADANRDGYISEEELNALVRYAFRLGYTIN